MVRRAGRTTQRLRRHARGATIQVRRAGWHVVRPFQRDKAWTFAAMTGVAGVALLFLLALSHRHPAKSSSSPVADEVVTPLEPPQVVFEPPPSDDPLPPIDPSAMALAEPPPAPDPFASLALDPPPVQPEPTELPPPVDPPAMPVPAAPEPLPLEEPLPVAMPVPQPLPVEEPPPLLTVELARLALPAEMPAAVLARGEVRPPERLDIAPLADEGWDALQRNRLPRPVLPVLYAERISPETMQQISAEIEANVEPLEAQPASGEAHLSIEKTAPRQATVQDVVRYAIVVRNEGPTPVERVVVEEHLPAAAQVADVAPAGALDNQTLRWHLRGLRPGEEQRLNVQLIPTREGTAASTASVRSFVSVASETRVQAIQLKLEMSAPPHVRQGTVCPIEFVVTNTGAVAAANVVLSNDLPPELTHELGHALECEVGTLEPGQSRRVRLVARAEAVGQLASRATLSAAGTAAGQAEAAIHVYEPALRIRRLGYRRTPVGQMAVYTNVLINQSDRAAEAIEVVETVPPGLDVIKVSHDGVFDPAARTIRWQLATMDGGQTQRLDVTVRPTATGRQESTVTARAGDEAAPPILARIEVTPARPEPTATRPRREVDPCEPCRVR